MRNVLTLPAPLVTALLPTLELRQAIRIPLATMRLQDGIDFLAPLRLPGERTPAPVELLLSREPTRLRGVPFTHWHGLRTAGSGTTQVHLYLFDDGTCSGAVLRYGIAQRLHAVQVVGPAMLRIEPGEFPRPLGGVPARGTFSRLIGALGGRSPMRRLRQLRVAVVGVSRLGSLLATSLAKAGVRELALIDADRVERHHLPAMDLPDVAAVGTPKVHATARLLAAVAPWTRVQAIAADLQDPAAVLACSSADVLVTAPDQPEPRLLAGMLAVAGHRVLLDVGTGVFGAGERFEAGADVRLLLPGDPCILCAGGLDLATRPAGDFRRNRAGSLRSLNQMAVGFALFQLERLLVGQLAGGAWWQLQALSSGEVAVRAMPIRAAAECTLCRLAGAGDAVWRLARRADL
jgi:hypothetical protein